VIWLMLFGLATAKPTGQEVTVGRIPKGVANRIVNGRVTLTIDVQMAPVDGIPMSRARSATVDFELGTAQSGKQTVKGQVLQPAACRFRVPLAASWDPAAQVGLRVIVTGDPLPMEVQAHLPEGAKLVDDWWVVTAPTGDLVLDLPACG